MAINQKLHNYPLPPVEHVLDLVRRERATNPEYDRSADMQELDARADEYTRLLWEIARQRATLEKRLMDAVLLRETNTLAGLESFIARHANNPAAIRAKEFLSQLPGYGESSFDQGFMWVRFLLSSPMYTALARHCNGAPMTH